MCLLTFTPADLWGSRCELFRMRRRPVFPESGSEEMWGSELLWNLPIQSECFGNSSESNRWNPDSSIQAGGVKEQGRFPHSHSHTHTEISVWGKAVHENLLHQLNRAKQAAQDTKRQAENMQDRLNATMNTFEKEKNTTKELIRRAKDFLMGQSADLFAPWWTETTSLLGFPPWQMTRFTLTTWRGWPELSWASDCHDHLIKSRRWLMRSITCWATSADSRMT